MHFNTMAQTLVPPTGLLPDVNWFTAPATSSTYTILGLNTAMIDYAVNASNFNTIAATAYYGGGTNYGGITVTDLASSTTVTYAYTTTPTMISTPDIILGNDPTSPNPATDFKMAVAFINNSGNIEIDFFRISFTLPYTGAFNIIYLSNYIITPAFGYVASTVHIDVVAEAGNLFLGLPLCEKFFITWDERIGCCSSQTVYAAMASLTSGALLSSVQNITTGSGSTYYAIEPDVAGVQWPAGGSQDFVARIAMLDAQRDYVYYADWNAGPTGAGTTITAPLTYDYNTSSTFYTPRIDAIDNYTASTSTVTAVYKIAAANTSLNTIRTYDNLQGPRTGGTSYFFSTSSIINLSGLGIGYSAASHHLPTVAYGPNDGGSVNEYMITEIAHDLTPADIVMMAPLDYTSSTGYLAYDPSAVDDYFVVNDNYAAPENIGNCNYANSASTPCNHVAFNSIIAWAWDNGGTHQIDYKTCVFDPSPGTGYNYRKSNDSKVPTSSSNNHKLLVYPNPATDYITIDNPDNSCTGYSIKNILGQTVLQGSLTVGNQNIAINMLSTGSYSITLYQGNRTSSNKFFVKQ